MSENIKNINVARDNSSARERGESIAREYERIVSTFNRVLEFKEKVRLSLENRVVSLQEHIKNNAQKLSTLNRNIEIYDLNVSKIATNIDEISSEEMKIKDQYNKLLQGASMEMVGVNIDDEIFSEEGTKDGVVSTENLMQKRNHYIDGLNSSFHKLDDDLQSINCLRTELLNARSEIFRKKEIALDKKAEVQENEKCLKVALDKHILDLDNSIKEEELLTREYAQLINTVDGCIVLSEDIDRVLFSSLTSANENE